MDRADYIRGVFNDVYTEQILPVWGRVGYKRFDRGLEIWDGSYGEGNGHALVPWSDVAEQMWQMLTGVEVEQTTADGQELPSLEQQEEAIEQAETEKVPALSYSQEQIDNAILSGSHFAGGKLRIYEQFQKNLPIDENAAFLKKEYGVGGSSTLGENPDISFNGKGFYIGSSFLGRGPDSLFLSWKKVAKRIAALIEADRFLTDDEKAEYEKYRAGKTQDKPEQTYRYHLGDTVYIGKDEYTISGIGDTMRLHDESFPLVDTEMPRAEFERKVRENPRNDHLLSAEAPVPAADALPLTAEKGQPEQPVDAEKLFRDAVLDDALVEWNHDLASKQSVVAYLRQHDVGPDTQKWLAHELNGDKGDGLIHATITGIKFDFAFSWPEVEQHLLQMVAENRFFTPYEKEQLSSTAAENGEIQNAADETGPRYEVVLSDAFPEEPYTIWDNDADNFYEKSPDGSWATFLEEDQARVFLYFLEKGQEEAYWKYMDAHSDLLITEDDHEDDYEDIDPAAIRAELERRGIVNGQVVDKAANDASPFVSQVMQDVQRLAEEENPVPDISEHPITREGDTITIGDGPATHEVTVTLPDEEWEQVKEAVPEKNDTDAGQAKPKYRIGTKVYIDNKLYEIVQSYEDYVVVMDRTVPDPMFRMVTTEQFVTLLWQDPRNGALFEMGVQEQPQPDYTVEPVVLYPGDKNGMPFDVAVEKLHTEEPARGQPSTPAVPAQNFHITDDTLGYGGAKAKYAANIAAIQTLRAVESEHRNATQAEQEILSRYVGWGGVSDAFDPGKPAWAKEYQELKDLLTPDEYNSARSSTLNAHYTSPTVIRAMYQALENMGFRTGNILEPSCGVGNFFGMLPESMAGSKLYGVELDGLTGRIAKLLYPKADITVAGFETTSRRDFYDVAIGNVPFGQYQVNDPAYNKLHFSIHNYFFAKSLDQVRPGGVVAFVVSRFLMDAKDPTVRKYLAQRAELLGALRLPNNAFKNNANTDVVTDVLFLQKRENPIVDEPDWVHLGQTEKGIPINSYYIDHPEMVLGEITTESTQYGQDELTIAPIPGADLNEQLKEAIQNISGRYEELDLPELADDDVDKTIPADPNVRNFSYTLVDGVVYYRENSRMKPVQVSTTALNRIRGLVGLRNCVQRLIDYQMDDAPDELVQREQARLNDLYDAFTAQYGLINSRGNEQAFSDDSSYFLLCSLEVIDKDGNLERKADFFTKRTIRRPEHVTHVDTASEALTLSLNEQGCVDMEYMADLTGKSEAQMESDLQGVIFRDTGRLTQQQAEAGAFEVDDLPLVTADEYLSGNVRKKLAVARAAQKAQPIRLAENVTALEKVQPVDLTASEISVRLGATWIPVEDVQRFMYQLLDPPFYYRTRIKLHFTKANGEWYIENKSFDQENVKVSSTYGTKRANAYHLLEDALNLRDTKIFDYVQDASGKRKPVLNKNETTIAQQKQDMIRQAFVDWIWKDQDRRDRLCKLYNEKFNSVRPREYDGSHLTFPGMNPQIKLRPHQTNAIAHILYGGNTLLAHCVGAGKTYEMAAAAMESKRLGLSQKAMFVVPNHIISQWASEFLQLYPSANLLVARKKDFETKNRKKFCGRIATGDYDAIIIGHSQFEKIAMSLPRQRYLLECQIDEIIEGIDEIRHNKGERSTIKSLERTRKSLQAKLDKLNDQSRKDDVIDFEALGVDRLFVDEAHYYKNLFLYSKMRNVGGIAQTEAQKSSDLFLKCRYLDEKTGNHGVVFATGTPVSNSMVELYTMQRYLQYDQLAEQDLVHFDSWASTFGETVTAIELSPEGYNF